MKLKCIAIDDEPFALMQIAGYIRKTPFLELTAECRNAFEAMDYMASNPANLLFVDINMPGMSGMDFVKTLPAGIGIIFTTAYSEYAVESYKTDAIGYLLKPINYDDFLRAANKAQKVLKGDQQKETDKPEASHFFVNTGGKMIRVNMQDIDFIESMSEYVKIHLSNQTGIVTLMRLKNLEVLLPAGKFMRVHRSYIVNLQNITTIERNRIVFHGSTHIPVSEQYRSEFRKFIENQFLD